MTQAAGKTIKMSSKKRSTERSAELAAWKQGSLIDPYIHPELAQQGIKRQDYQLNDQANMAQDLMSALVDFEQQACELEGLSQHQQAIHEFSQGIKHLWESGSLPDETYDASVLQHILGGHQPSSDALLEPEVDEEVAQVETYACRFYESVLTRDSSTLSDTARMLWTDFKSHDPFRRNAANFALVSSRYIQAGGEYNHEYLADLLKQTDNADLLTEDVGVTDIETLGSVTHAIKRGTLSIGHVFATNNPEAQTHHFVSDVEKYREAIQAVNEEELKERLNERASQQIGDEPDDESPDSEPKQAIPTATYEQFAALISDVYNCLTKTLSVGSIQAQKQAMDQKQKEGSDVNSAPQVNEAEEKESSASNVDSLTNLNHHEQPEQAQAVSNAVFSLPNKPVAVKSSDVMPAKDKPVDLQTPVQPEPTRIKPSSVAPSHQEEPTRAAEPVVAKSPQPSMTQKTEPTKVDTPQPPMVEQQKPNVTVDTPQPLVVEEQKPTVMVEEPKQAEATAAKSIFEPEVAEVFKPVEVMDDKPDLAMMFELEPLAATDQQQAVSQSLTPETVASPSPVPNTVPEREHKQPKVVAKQTPPNNASNRKPVKREPVKVVENRQPNKEIVLTLEPMEIVNHQPNEADTPINAAINTSHISHVTISGVTKAHQAQTKPVVISTDEVKASTSSKVTASVASSNNLRQDTPVVAASKPIKKTAAPIREVDVEIEAKVSADVPIKTHQNKPVVNMTDESTETQPLQAVYDSTLMYESIFDDEPLEEEIADEPLDEYTGDIRYKLSETSELLNPPKREATPVENATAVMNKAVDDDTTQATSEPDTVEQPSVNTTPHHNAFKQHELMPLSFAASLYAGQPINNDDLLVQMVERIRFDYHSGIVPHHDTAMFALVATHYHNLGGSYNYQQLAWLLNATGNSDLLYEGIGQIPVPTLAAIAFALQRGTLQLWQVFLHDSGLDAMGTVSILNAQTFRQAIHKAMNEASNPINKLITDFAPAQSQAVQAANAQQNATTISSQDDFQRYISAINQQGSLDQAVFTQQGAVPPTSARAYQLECLAAEYYAKARINTVQDMTDYAHTLWADFYAEQESYKSAGTFALVASRYREAGGEFDYEQLAHLLESTGHARFVTGGVGRTELETLGAMVDALRLGRLGIEDIFAGARGLDAMNKVSVKHGQLYQQAMMAIMQGDVSSDIK